MKTRITLTLTLLVCLTSARAGLLDALGFGKKATTNEAGLPAALTSSLSQEQVAQGLKEALGKGVQQAVSRLGHDGGFLTNPAVRIPMPEKLRTAEKALRVLKQDKLADEFVTTMNQAAEQAVPAAAGVFGQAVQGMSLADARAILAGTNNAATQYFRRATETNLHKQFLPIVKQATDQAGVTSAYKRLVGQAGTASAFGSVGRSLLGAESMDVDAYVTDKALEGLFQIVAEEEKRIRENPAARTTEVLQKVFGAVTR
ncbi:MAG TPA: DUF4197 domain-containing protein [Verrucomicrobiota bacterium]|nr:DUF4197 domain-containing protein [Verrucomicrobiota bacterium]HQL80409.1 DUF4197 domain-containing protein [Verrucomicrobiota bacterium]